MKKLTVLFALLAFLFSLAMVLVNKHEGSEVYRLEVAGDSISDLVRRGNYDCFDSNINDDNFATDVPHKAEIILKHCSKYGTEEAALKALDAEGLRPVTMSELLELGSRYPELQKQFPIVGLGSVWQDPDGRRGVGFLCYDGGQRRLGLRWIDFDWGGRCRFAAVRK